MWYWLAANPSKGKRDWPGWERQEVLDAVGKNIGILMYRCFACAVRNFSDNCENCPIQEWVLGVPNIRDTPCEEEGAMYYHWCLAQARKDAVESSRWAIMIAEAWR